MPFQYPTRLTDSGHHEVWLLPRFHPLPFEGERLEPRAAIGELRLAVSWHGLHLDTLARVVNEVSGRSYQFAGRYNQYNIWDRLEEDLRHGVVKVYRRKLQLGSGSHAHPGEREEPIHDGFRDDPPVDIEPSPQPAPPPVKPTPHAHFLELEDLVFATDREVLLPDALGALIVIAQFAREHPEKRLLVAGHTDTAGSDTHNRALSQRRAENVQLWLAGKVHAWAAHCQENFERADFKAIHAWAHRYLGWATDPGELDNTWHAQARQARDVFRSECEALLEVQLEHHVAQNEGDWRATHDLYSLIVARYLDLEPAESLELRQSFLFCQPVTLACGEDFPRDRPGQDNTSSAANRRVDVLFFDPDELPQLGGSPPGASIYADDEYILHELDVRDLDPLTPALLEVHIQLYDHWHQDPVSDSSYRLSGPLPERLFQREGETDAAGFVHEELLPSGHYELQVGEATVTVISHPVGFADPNHPQVGPDFPDVYRLPGHTSHPVFPSRPSGEDPLAWLVPAYEEGPDRETGHLDEGDDEDLEE